MEVSPTRLVKHWKITVLGTLLQISLSVCTVWILGYFLHWPISRIVLLGFVISLSSTVVVIQLLRTWGELDSRIGQDTLGILLVQDIALVPMIIILGLLNNQSFDGFTLALQLVGATFVIASVIWISRKPIFSLRWMDAIAQDKEMQVFTSLFVCTSFALITGLMQLSTALGAFIAGVFVSRIRETSWISDSLDSMRILFVALFFLSIGMLIDIHFVMQHLYTIAFLVVAVLATNSVINALILRIFGYQWRSSAYAGALLSQAGEFSFILATIGLQASIITDYSYQMTIALIAITLLISPVFIYAVRKCTGMGEAQLIPSSDSVKDKF